MYPSLAPASDGCRATFGRSTPRQQSSTIIGNVDLTMVAQFEERDFRCLWNISAPPGDEPSDVVRPCHAELSVRPNQVGAPRVIAAGLRPQSTGPWSNASAQEISTEVRACSAGGAKSTVNCGLVILSIFRKEIPDRFYHEFSGNIRPVRMQIVIFAGIT